MKLRAKGNLAAVARLGLDVPAGSHRAGCLRRGAWTL